MSNPIRSELETKLAAFAAAHVPPLPVAYEGVPFIKPSGPFLECFLKKSGTLDVTVDGTRQRELGLFLVNVWVKDGAGSAVAEDIAQGIINYFPIVPQTFSVNISNTPNASPAIVDANGWRVIPISIRWRAEIYR